MVEEEKGKSLEEEIKELKKAVSTLLEIEKMRIEREQKQEEKEPEIDKEALYEELKEVHLGELVRYAIINNLIRRGSREEE